MEEIETETTPISVKKQKARKSRWSNIIKYISVVFTELKMSHFSPNVENKDFIYSVNKLTEYLGLNEAQVFIFCTMFGVYFEVSERPITYFNIADSCECNPLMILAIRDELEGILDKGLIAECDPPDDSIGRSFYKIPEFVVQAILKNKSIGIDEANANYNIRDFLADVGRIIDNRIDNKLSCEMLFSKIERMEKRVKEIASLCEYLPNIADRAMLYDIAFGLVICNNPDLRSFVLINRNTDVSSRESVSKSIVDETHPLFRKDLVQFETKGSIQDSTISLTDKAYSLLFGAEGNSFQTRKTDRNIVLSANIKEKELFYSKTTKRNLRGCFMRWKQKILIKSKIGFQKKGSQRGFVYCFTESRARAKPKACIKWQKKAPAIFSAWIFLQ